MPEKKGPEKLIPGVRGWEYETLNEGVWRKFGKPDAKEDVSCSLEPPRLEHGKGLSRMIRDTGFRKEGSKKDLN